MAGADRQRGGLGSRRPVLDGLGVKDLILGALPGNTDAIRLYERRGYQPTWLYLSRFDGRSSR
jgi:ribosomal protein S18 acetylase RimI-like enzyme